MIKIAIVGPECSGKSTLVEKLSKHFDTSYAKEIARDYLHEQSGAYTQKDLVFMAKLQLEEEEISEENAQEVLFCDTNLLNFLIWSEVKYGNVSKKLKELWNPNNYDLHLICFPDLPYEADELREHPTQSDREWLFRLHEANLIENESKFVVIRGKGEERTQSAIEAILKEFPSLRP